MYAMHIVHAEFLIYCMLFNIDNFVAGGFADIQLVYGIINTGILYYRDYINVKTAILIKVSIFL